MRRQRLVLYTMHCVRDTYATKHRLLCASVMRSVYVDGFFSRSVQQSLHQLRRLAFCFVCRRLRQRKLDVITNACRDDNMTMTLHGQTSHPLFQLVTALKRIASEFHRVRVSDATHHGHWA
ncbi:hypothetical protein WH47_01759 [Habropoda laboriosa]|uniref:Uncharacterized protein n=1 Tax=Habropoda laboriosa TaxID=597456 RepID=A0A0L7RK55_9HYME|nr:hypothetical protein WH47_01759 [Habropoda laboriosa]